MNIKYAIATLAACTMLSGTALAEGPKHKKNKNQNHSQMQNRNQTSSTSVAAGIAGANRNGAVAGGVGAGQATQQSQMGRRGGQQMSGQQMQVPNSAATSTNGAVFTTRRSGSAAISTNGAAAGSGSVRSSSEGEVFSSTDRQGSEADAFGNSEAEAEEARRTRPQL